MKKTTAAQSELIDYCLNLCRGNRTNVIFTYDRKFMHSGEFDPVTNTITVKSTYQHWLGTLLHEVRHMLQYFDSIVTWPGDDDIAPNLKELKNILRSEIDADKWALEHLDSINYFRQRRSRENYVRECNMYFRQYRLEYELQEQIGKLVYNKNNRDKINSVCPGDRLLSIDEAASQCIEFKNSQKHLI